VLSEDNKSCGFAGCGSNVKSGKTCVCRAGMLARMRETNGQYIGHFVLY
jgi:hypothetical protein